MGNPRACYEPYRQGLQASFCVLGTVDRLERWNNELAILPGHELQRVADQMHNTSLDQS